MLLVPVASLVSRRHLQILLYTETYVGETVTFVVVFSRVV